MDEDSLTEDIINTVSHDSTSSDDEDDVSRGANELSSAPDHSIPAEPASTEDEPPAHYSIIDSGSSPSIDGFLVSSRPESAPEPAEPPVKSRLNLLDLPLDILKEIFKEITLTNDLTSLALTCSALHALAIPAMYSRFDIVWPEPGLSSDHPIGVDALSYGLATLVMGDHVFRELPPATSLSDRHYCHHCGCQQREHQTSRQASTIATRFGNIRFGNYYAQWTKKFSVGNGPPESVQEYAITKETGKMLGTLVALAVARMINLESFIWDMPTGVMRDIFLALASLGTRANHECRLEQVWIRWHDNTENNSIRAMFTATNSSANNPLQLLMHRYGHIEYPTFSVLPPLKSLTVLNIDEPAYLEEMAILIDRSRHKLAELRIGMAARCSVYEWVYPTDMRPALVNSNPRRATPGWPRHGGVLSILLEDSETPEDLPPELPGDETTENKGDNNVSAAPTVVASPDSSDDVTTAAQILDGLAVEERQETNDSRASLGPNTSVDNTAQGASESQLMQENSTPATTNKPKKIMLEVLELEHVVLSAPVLMKALDWTRLSTLTLLHCEEHESLWRALRRAYSPAPSTNPLNAKETIPPKSYPLKLKHLHTDRISPYLMLFLKETIAPNTLESLYFQEGNFYESIVSIEAIYKHVLRRQRASLQKVLIDRSRSSEAVSSNHGHWRQWMLPREALSFVTSGRMPQLRELGIGMDRRDWHFFLQRLPNVPHLRALYLPNMFDPTLKRDKQRELALQILDIVALRPEIQLCYVGIETKCFEILETTSKNKKPDEESYLDPQWSAESEAESENEDQIHDHGSDNETDEDEDTSSVSSSDEDDGYSEEDEENGIGSASSNVVFKLREILYYDDKISIFKARHCSL